MDVIKKRLLIQIIIIDVKEEIVEQTDQIIWISHVSFMDNVVLALAEVAP